MMLALLRSETAAVHQRLEARAWENKLGAERVERRHYENFLLAHLLAYTRVEHALQMIDSPYSLTSRQQFIAEDLEKLKVELPLIELEGDGEEAHWQYPEWLGINYVILGSALGGKTILRKLGEDKALKRLGAFNFLSFQQKEGVENWQSFQSLIGEEAGAAHQQRLVKAARLTFQYFLYCFDFVDDHSTPDSVRLPALSAITS